MSVLDLRDELRARYGTPATPVETATDSAPEPERAFVFHSAKGRAVITAPLREIAAANPGFTYLHGRFVGADEPNGNGALWTSDDLQLGEKTVAGGPLNWLHDERHIIGALVHGEMVAAGREDAAGGHVPTHLAATAVAWNFLYPREVQTMERAAKDKGLYYSMECISREVSCIDTPGRPGCGETVSYDDYDSGKCCQHLRERSSIRRFVDPVFLGGAIIVPPVQPGWSAANVDVVRQAAALSEQADLTGGNMTNPTALALATAVLEWANRD